MTGFPGKYTAFPLLFVFTLMLAMPTVGAPGNKLALEFKRKVKEMYQFAKEMEKSGLAPDEVITVTIPGTVFDPPKPVPIVSKASASYDTPGKALVSWLNANLAKDPAWRREAIHPTEVASIKGESEKVNEGSEFAVHGFAEFHGVFVFFLTHKCRFSTGGLDYVLVVKTDDGFRFTRAAYKLDKIDEMKLMDIITKNYILYADTRGKLVKAVLEAQSDPAANTSDPVAGGPVGGPTTEPASEPAIEPSVEEEDASLSVVVKGVNNKGFPVVALTNNETRDIDNIMGGISITDADGQVLFSTGVNDWVTGSVYIKSGETKEISLYITPDAQDRNPEGKRLLRDEPQSLTGKFEVKKVTFIQPH